jgi:hypothetical protein
MDKAPEKRNIGSKWNAQPSIPTVVAMLFHRPAK